MKKTLKRTLLILVVLALVGATAFSQGTKDQAAGSKMVIKAANAAQDGDSLDTAMKYFVSELAKRTDGLITGSVFPNSQLGNHSDFIGSLQIESIQVAESTAAVLSTVAPKFSVFDLPYVVPNSAELVYQQLSGRAGEILNEDLIKNAD